MQGLNEQICQWFAISMLHLLWQGLIPFAIWLAFNRWFVDRPQTRYAVGLLALASIAACLPINLYSLRPGTISSLSQALRSDPNAASTSLFIASSQAVNASVQYPQTGVASAGPFTPASTKSIQSSGLLTPDVYPWLVALYLAGVTLFSVRMLTGSWQTWQLRRNSHPVNQSHVLKGIQRATLAAKLAIAPAVRWCDVMAVPALVGVLKPMILLPAHCATELSASQIEQIVLHELTHFRRYDPILNMLQNLIETLFFFHPVVWHISNQVRLDRELSCDQAVIAAGHQPEDYALLLVQIASLCKQHNLSPLIGMASTGKPSQLQIRVHSLLHQYHRIADGGLHVFCGILVVIGLLAASTQMLNDAQAQQLPAAEQPDAKAIAAPENTSSTKEVFGIVVDNAGKPIAGASVDVFPYFGGDVTTTDENGRFRLPLNVNQGLVEMSITKDQYCPYYVDSQEVGVEMNVSLNQDTYLEGVVLAPGGQPAPNAEIIVKRDLLEHFYHHRMSQSLIVTNSDASGRYRVHVAPDVAYEVRVRSPGVGASRLRNIKAVPGEHKVVDLSLNTPIRFEAKVVDSDSGKPVAGVHLFSLIPYIEGTSDDSGKLVIEDMWPGLVNFEVGQGDAITDHTGKYYLPKTIGRWWSEQSNVWSQKRINGDYSFQYNFAHLIFDLTTGMQPITIHVEKGVTFRGTVYDPDGQPIAGATVTPVRTGSGNSLSGDNRFAATTDADGKYELLAPAGKVFRYNLMAHDGELQQWRTWANGITYPFESKPGEVKNNANIRLARPASVRGRVIESDGRSCAGSKVSAAAADMNESNLYNPAATVQPDGTFELNFLREGKHSLQLETSNNSVSIDVKAGKVLEGIELKMPEFGERSAPELASRKFQITLLDSSGKPSANQSVLMTSNVVSEWPQSRDSLNLDMQWPLAGPESTFDTNWDVLKSRLKQQFITNMDGQFELNGERFLNSANPVTLLAYDGSNSTCAVYRLFADVRDPHITIKMAPLRKVNLELLNASRDAVEVSLYFNGLKSLRIPSDASGALEQIYLPPGKYRLSKRKQPTQVNGAEEPMTFRDFEIPEDEANGPLDIKVPYGHKTQNTQAR